MSIRFLFLPLFLGFLPGCQSIEAQDAPKQPDANVIETNQLGYPANGAKRAVIRGVNGRGFHLVTQENDTVFSGKTGPEQIWEATDQWAAQADFSQVTTPGFYMLVVEGISDREEVQIVEDPYGEAARKMVKSLYFQRSSSTLVEPYAERWPRAAGHLDQAVITHSSAASSTRPENSTLAFPGGWYDAGDYGKYCGPTSFVTWSLLHLLELNPSWINEELNIPESKDALPDVLNEALVGLRFLLSVQDENGSVPHKLTALRHAALLMPAGDKDQRYLIGQSTATTLTFVAATAQAARILKKYDAELPGLADSCLQAAERAWQWAEANPAVNFRNPDDVHTGEYKDDFVEDEKAWALLELWLSTGNNEYRQVNKLFEVVQNRNPFHGDASWKAMLSMSLHSDRLTEAERRQWKEQLKWRSQRMKEYARANAYHVPLGFNDYDFNWGSNAIQSRMGLWYLMTAQFTGVESWKGEAVHPAEYLLGKNPLDLSFVTGIGERYPLDIHHRPSKADGVGEPIPGLMAGGPQIVVKQADCEGYPSDKAALRYLDSWCSYTTNEIAINWNANAMLFFAWLSRGLE